MVFYTEGNDGSLRSFSGMSKKVVRELMDNLCPSYVFLTAEDYEIEMAASKTTPPTEA